MSYYNGKRDRIKTNITRYIVKYAKKLKLIISKGGKCEKCGIQDLDRPWIYQFHHIDKKNKEEIFGFSLSYEKLKKEAKKCICVCENCHRKIHSLEKTINKSDIHKQLFLSYKKTNCCEKCNYNDCIKSLDFHHMENKDLELADLITKSSSKVIELKEVIEKELDKCKVLCSNCHRDEHNDKEKFQKYKKQIYEKMENLKDNYSKNIDRNKVLSLNKKGLSQAKIAKLVGCAVSTVCEILKSNNIHTFIEKKTLDVNKIKELREQGKTNPEIAEILGCNRFSIAQALKRHRLKKD